MKKNRLFLTLALAALMFAACPTGDDDDDGGGVTAVSGVTVSPFTASVAKGGTRNFAATVEGTGNLAQTVSWMVSGNDSPGTTISPGGILTVAVNETALSLTVRASSTVDTGKSGTAMVTVPLSYMNMVLATPNADDSVTITGNSAYYYDSSVDYNKGVFIEGRTVTLSPFYIAQYETTYELWYKVYQWAIGNGYTFANAGREGDDGTIGVVPTEPTTKYKPVTYINWRDAVVWCNAYSEMSGKEPVYYTDSDYSTVLRVSTNDSGTGTVADGAAMKLNAKGWRLPTEAEWEYAARGGGTPSTTGTFAYRWVGTDTQSQLGTYAWYSGNSGSATHQVGGKQATSLGLYDMSGNVWEWCWDRYTNSVGTGTELNPIGPISGSLRVYRGGSWNSDASHCAVALRGAPYPGVMEGVIGFRLVLCP